MSRFALLGLLAIAFAAQGTAETLTRVETRDRKVVRRWELPGDPRGVAVGADGTVYAGLADPQAVIAVDPETGHVRKRLVLDSPEIASTKELVVMRTDAAKKRLFVANGSDESATILSIPDLAVLREITMEGEVIRDILPDPKGRYVFLLGRTVHVFDSEGDREIKTLPIEDPMAIAVSSDGTLLAVLATETFGTVNATMVVFIETQSFTELRRDPLQTEKAIEAAMFAARDTVLVAFARDSLFETQVASRASRMKGSPMEGAMRMVVGDLVNVINICLPENSGPQIGTLAGSDRLLVYAERRCSSSGTSLGANQSVRPASLYGIGAWALAWDGGRNAIVATDPAGFLTLYHVPRVASAR